MRLFKKKGSRFFVSTLVTGMLSLLFTGIPLAQAVQPNQDQLQNEIKEMKEEIAQIKEQIAKLQVEVQTLKGQPIVQVPPLKEGQVPLNKVFQKIPGWKVTLTSYEFLKSGGLQFNFVIENLQDEEANFGFCWRESKRHQYVVGWSTRWYINPIKVYILDEKTNKYYNPQVIPPDEVTLIPGMPVEGKITFTQTELAKAKVIVFYFGFYGKYLAANQWKITDVLAVGPIKLR